jgi:hypothetical protein
MEGRDSCGKCRHVYPLPPGSLPAPIGGYPINVLISTFTGSAKRPIAAMSGSAFQKARRLM